MTTVEYRVYADGVQVGAYLMPALALAHAWKAKEREPEQAVAVVLLNADEAALTDDDYRARPFAMSPAEQAAEVVPIRKPQLVSERS